MLRRRNVRPVPLQAVCVVVHLLGPRQVGVREAAEAKDLILAVNIVDY